MKKILTHLFVVLCNYYILKMFITFFKKLLFVFSESTELMFDIMPIDLMTLLACIIYQMVRHRIIWYSYGERVIANKNKRDILDQQQVFSINKLPLNVLIFATLLVFTASEFHMFQPETLNLGTVALYGLLIGGLYYSTTQFCKQPVWHSIGLLSVLFLFLMIGIQYSQTNEVVKSQAIYIYSGSIAAWIIIGGLYLKKKVTEQIPSTE